MCENPYIVPDYNFAAPCGKCAYCRKKKSSEWSMRLVHHFETTGRSATFITFTYDDVHLPKDYGLNHRHFQLYMKVLRNRFLDRKLTYFMSGEYGSRTQRPHYHAIIFGIQPYELISVSDYIPLDEPGKFHDDSDWRYGYIFIGSSVTYETCAYVAQYTQKKRSTLFYEGSGRVPPYCKMSKGIGLQWCYQYKEQILDKMYIEQGEFKQSVPRYYCDKLGINRKVVLADTIEEFEQKLVDQMSENGITVFESTRCSRLDIDHIRAYSSQGRLLLGSPITIQAQSWLLTYRKMVNLLIRQKISRRKERSAV